jgi:hypothetical protein
MDPNSNITIFSCYKEEYVVKPRILHVKNKVTQKEHQIPLLHNSFTVIPYDFNAKHVHKIVGQSKWLGMTFRTSKTFLEFEEKEENPRFLDSQKPLTLATKEEEKQFYKLRSLENQEVFRAPLWPKLDFTISPSDLLRPKT